MWPCDPCLLNPLLQAIFLRRMPLSWLRIQDMEKQMTIYDTTIDPIVDLARGKIKNIHIFIIDGCQAHAFVSAIRNKKLFPHLREYMDYGHLYFTNCCTVFPSVTLPCHASIITGTYPGAHGITGNNWFQHTDERRDFKSATTGYVKFGTLNNPGLFQKFGRANIDLSGNVKTLFEAYKEKYKLGKCASIFEFIYRGLSEKEVIRPGFKFIYNYLYKYYPDSWIFSRNEDIMRKKALKLDRQAMELTVDRIKVEQPKITVTWLPGLDYYSHEFGAKKQSYYMQEFAELDIYFGKLKNLINQLERLDNTLIIITSDHGQYDCLRDTSKFTYLITKEELYRQILKNPIDLDPWYLKNLPIKLSKQLEIERNSVSHSIVFAENGGMCHVYVKEKGDDESGWWGHPKRFTNPEYVKTLKSLCTIFSTFGGIDKIFVKRNNEEYFLWDKSNNKKTSLKLDSRTYPNFEKRINSLASTNRSGDIIFSAKSGFYFEDKKFYGEHGSLSITDTHVPLLMISPCLKSLKDKKKIIEFDDIVSTTMITPTIAKAMDFYNNLITPIDEKKQIKELQKIAQNEILFLESEIEFLNKMQQSYKYLDSHSKETKNILNITTGEMGMIIPGMMAYKDSRISKKEYVDHEISLIINGLSESIAELKKIACENKNEEREIARPSQFTQRGESGSHLDL